MGNEQLAYASATELLRLIAGKQVSPVELTELFFSRIERLDTRLNSFLLLTREAALAQARAAEAAVVRGDELGALHGLPISIKDTQMTAGIRTTMGSVWFEDRVPERDAAVVERVRAGPRRHPGQDERLRAGHRRHLPEPARPRRGQPLEPRPYARRVERGRGGGTGRVSVPPGYRQRRGRLDPHSLPFLRDLRHQAHAGAGVGLHRGRIRADAEHLLPERAPGAHGAGRGAAAPGPCRARPAGPDLAAGGAGRLRRRGGSGHRRHAHRLESGLRFRGRAPGRRGRDVSRGLRVRGPGMPRRGAEAGARPPVRHVRRPHDGRLVQPLPEALRV